MLHILTKRSVRIFSCKDKSQLPPVDFQAAMKPIEISLPERKMHLFHFDISVEKI